MNLVEQWVKEINERTGSNIIATQSAHPIGDYWWLEIDGRFDELIFSGTEYDTIDFLRGLLRYLKYTNLITRNI